VHSGVVVIDFRRCGTAQLYAIYQDFGLLCSRGGVRCALLKTGDEDADAHYALRDMLRTVALIAEIPLELRLAMVASSGAVASVGLRMRKELRVLGCDAQVFRTEREAKQWLRVTARATRGARAAP
jgi:hypothetical protein